MKRFLQRYKVLIVVVLGILFLPLSLSAQTVELNESECLNQAIERKRMNKPFKKVAIFAVSKYGSVDNNQNPDSKDTVVKYASSYNTSSYNASSHTKSSYLDKYKKPDGYEGPLPECAFDGSCADVNKLLELVINIGKWFFSIIGSLAFVFFVYGGFTMILSFGSAEKFKKGQQVLVAAVIGMIIAFGAYALVNFLLTSLGVSDSFIFVK